MKVVGETLVEKTPLVETIKTRRPVMARMATAALTAGIGYAIFAGCLSPAQARPAAPAVSRPVMRVIFVDLTESARSPEDVTRWVETAKLRIFDRMTFGDGVVILPVDDHTAEAAPLFDKTVPKPRPGAGMEEILRARALLRQAREGGMRALAEAFRSPSRARSTRLLDSIRRVPHVPGTAVEVYYLSDMLESSPDLDLETIRLSRRNIPVLAQAAVTKHRFPAGAISGVTVYCILDSPALGSAQRLNSRDDLDMFWRSIFTGLGGDLAVFDSRLGN